MSRETTMSRATSKTAARADAQRARILDAAQACFIADGFHAATMATLAARAGVSAGLIYRYFENKEAIVQAIIERELEQARSRIAHLHGSVDFVKGLVESFREIREREPGTLNAALYLEMSAEATRDKAVAAAVARADRLTRGDLQAWLQRPKSKGGHGLSEAEAASRALLLQILFAGLAVRSARDPSLDPEALRRALALAL